MESYDDCLRLLRLGEYHRHYAETKMNHQSSRSHTLFRLHVESVTADQGASVIKESVLVSEAQVTSLELCGPRR